MSKKDCGTSILQVRFPASRRMGGSFRGGSLRGGRAVSTWAVAALIRATASSKAASVADEVFCTPLTLRTYWRAAASISSGVAGGSRPRRVVMLRHMHEILWGAPQETAVDQSRCPTGPRPPGRPTPPWDSPPDPPPPCRKDLPDARRAHPRPNLGDRLDAPVRGSGEAGVSPRWRLGDERRVRSPTMFVLPDSMRHAWDIFNPWGGILWEQTIGGPSPVPSGIRTRRG